MSKTQVGYEFTVAIGALGVESFQILVNGDWCQRLFPSINEASPYEHHEILGPDEDGRVCDVRLFLFGFFLAR